MNSLSRVIENSLPKVFATNAYTTSMSLGVNLIFNLLQEILHINELLLICGLVPFELHHVLPRGKAHSVVRGTLVYKQLIFPIPEHNAHMV